MSKENILSFYSYMENDPKIFKKLRKLEKMSELSPEKFSKKVSKIAQKAGIDFSSNEMLEYLNEKKSYIDEENKALVAGGSDVNKNIEDFSKGELAIAKVAKRAILNEATEKANGFHLYTYKND